MATVMPSVGALVTSAVGGAGCVGERGEVLHCGARLSRSPIRQRRVLVETMHRQAVPRRLVPMSCSCHSSKHAAAPGP
jgi:hypothetical protein